MPFRAVNQPGCPAYRAGMQRHHLLPRQLLGNRHFAGLIEEVGSERIGFDDFRHNGLLLPALEQAAMVLGLPLHRGPHLRYNLVVAERMAQIDAAWRLDRLADPERAARTVLMRMRLLQQALRRSLLQPLATFCRLNGRDPNWEALDFADLDAMADNLWAESADSLHQVGTP